MAPIDLKRACFTCYWRNKTKEIIRETEIIEEGRRKGEPYRRMEIVKIDPRAEIVVKEKRETFLVTPAKFCNDCRHTYSIFHIQSLKAVDKCLKCGGTNSEGSNARRPSQFTVITRERELPEVSAFVDNHHRFLASLKELNDAT